MSLFQELLKLEEQGIDLIEILGQDSHLSSPLELQDVVRTLRRESDLYVELLYMLTHRRFPAAQARTLWQAIQKNKRRMEDGLGRAVLFRVAAADYLHAKSGILKGIRILAKPEMDQLLSYVHVDEVTSVFSRRYFNEALASEVQRARRYGSSMSLLVLDLDNFKDVNENYGHVEGDTVLRQTGRLIRDSTRQTDLVCRYGGDEFAVILPETHNSEAYTLAERIRTSIGRIVMAPAVTEISNGPLSGEDLEPADRDRVTLSASIGGATFPGDCDEGDELVRVADRLCLEAKRLGKNRIRMSGANGKPESWS